MVSIHDRPEEVEGRLVPGHHEGDLIKGSLASNSAVGTIVERHSGFVTLSTCPRAGPPTRSPPRVGEQMCSTTEPGSPRPSPGTAASRCHATPTSPTATGIDVYFADPYSPQQRPSNENTNGLLREYMPKGTDLSVHTRADLEAIAEAAQQPPPQTTRLPHPRRGLH